MKRSGARIRQGSTGAEQILHRRLVGTVDPATATREVADGELMTGRWISVGVVASSWHKGVVRFVLPLT